MSPRCVYDLTPTPPFGCGLTSRICGLQFGGFLFFIPTSESHRPRCYREGERGNTPRCPQNIFVTKNVPDFFIFLPRILLWRLTAAFRGQECPLQDKFLAMSMSSHQLFFLVLLLFFLQSRANIITSYVIVP